MRYIASLGKSLSSFETLVPVRAQLKMRNRDLDSMTLCGLTI